MLPLLPTNPKFRMQSENGCLCCLDDYCEWTLNFDTVAAVIVNADAYIYVMIHMKTDFD